MWKLIVLAIGLVALASVACADDPPEPTATPVPDTPAETLDVPAPTPEPEPTSPPAAEVMTIPQPVQETAPADDGKTRGGTFRRNWSDPPTLDPHMTTDTTAAGIVVEVFSGLVTINTDLQLELDLAESVDVSDDGRVYTFKLRPNAKFQSGKPVTAHDFKWSLERAANPETGSPVADTYLNDIIGVEDVLEGDATEISGVTVVDDQTLQITIDAPKAYFLAKLSYPTAFVLDRENVEQGGRNWTDTPNGTGPFRLAEYRVGERIVLERNDNYHRTPAYLDSVVMNLAGGQSMAMYENDEIDFTGVSLFDLERIQDPAEPLNQELVVAQPDFSVSYIGFNTNMNPFDDSLFRQALNHAIDKELIAREVFSDLIVPAYGILPPGFPGYDPTLKGLEYDPELAVQLLNESKYADPESRDRIVITVPGTGGTFGLDLEVILDMWKQVLGVEVEIQQVEWATFLQDLNQRKFQAFAGLGWQADYPDPQDFLDILFHTESEINHGGYSNPELDAILEEARTEQDVEARIALYHKAERMIVEDAAWVPLWYTGEQYVLIKPHVKGYEVTPMIISKLRQIHLE